MRYVCEYMDREETVSNEVETLGSGNGDMGSFYFLLYSTIEMFKHLCTNAKLCDVLWRHAMSWKTVSVKGQIVSNLGFVDHVWFLFLLLLLLLPLLLLPCLL